jgi:3',5'-cyclic AMP phosphodiesterase CpdA
MTESIRIYWITDLHFKDSVTGKPEAEDAIRRERHYYAAKDKLWQAVEMISRDKPDCVVCTGDMNDAVQSFATFTEAWDRVPEPKAITLGNHDLHNEYSTIVEELGYGDRPVVTGSHFNRSFALRKGDAQARVILLDTNIGPDGQHRSNVEGTIQEDAFRWLEEEMLGCAEKTILVFTHNGLGGPAKFFDQQHVERFTELANRVAAEKPGTHIYNMAGHHHVHPTAVVKELAPHFTFVNGVAMIAEAVSYINIVTVRAGGGIDLDYGEVRYNGAG